MAPPITTVSAVDSIIFAAETVKSETSAKIAELQGILANETLSSELATNLNTLLGFMNLLYGNLDRVTSTSSTAGTRFSFLILLSVNLLSPSLS